MAWSEGGKLAEVILREHHVAADFTEAFSHPDVDTLRPLSSGNYLGISIDPDRSIELSITSTDAGITPANEVDNDEGLDIFLTAWQQQYLPSSIRRTTSMDRGGPGRVQCIQIGRPVITQSIVVIVAEEQMFLKIGKLYSHLPRSNSMGCLCI